MTRYGIRFTLPPQDPMASPHLLGPDWEFKRWFRSEHARNETYEDLRREHLYSRAGDIPSLVMEKIEQ